MYQFFVESGQIGKDSVMIEGSDVNHIKNVLRMKPGEKIRISGPAGENYFCEIAEIEDSFVRASILEKDETGTELPNRIYLFQGLPKNDKMELIIQKAVELGVYEIIPVAMKNCVVKLDAKKAAAKTARWQGIAESAAKQSKRSLIPKVSEPVSYKEAVAYAMKLDQKLVPYENERGMAATREAVEAVRPGESIGIFIGPEGGFAPDFKNTGEAFSYLSKAVEKAGYRVGEDIVYAMDAAASELYDEARGVYVFPGESKENGEEQEIARSSEEMIAMYEELVQQFPIVSIEDGLFEDDWEGWQKLTKRLGDKVQLVGDDLFVTNPKRIQCGIKLGAANAVLVKVNQIGTVTESLNAIEMAKSAGYHTVISHRSGETEDAFIADLAVAVNAGQIKTGAPCRAERTSKYNQLLRIEEELAEDAVFVPEEITEKQKAEKMG